MLRVLPGQGLRQGWVGEWRRFYRKKKKKKKNPKKQLGDFPGGPVAKTLLPMQGGLGSVSDQGTRSHMPQLRVHAGMS